MVKSAIFAGKCYSAATYEDVARKIADDYPHNPHKWQGTEGADAELLEQAINKIKYDKHKAAQAIAWQYGFNPEDEAFAQCVGAILEGQKGNSE